MKKRIVSILTALALCLSLCPGWAFAAEGDVSFKILDTTLHNDCCYTVREDGMGIEEVAGETPPDAPYLEYTGGTLIVHGDVSLTGNTADPIFSITGGTLTVTGGTLTVTGGDSDSLTLTTNDSTETGLVSPSTVQALACSNNGSLQLAGSVDFTVNSRNYTSAVDNNNGNILTTTEDYNGDITLSTIFYATVQGFLTIAHAHNVTLTAAGTNGVIQSYKAASTISASGKVTIATTDQGSAVSGSLEIKSSAEVEITNKIEISDKSKSALFGGFDPSVTINSDGPVTLSTAGAIAYSPLTITNSGDVTITGNYDSGAGIFPYYDSSTSPKPALSIISDGNVRIENAAGPIAASSQLNITAAANITITGTGGSVNTGALLGGGGTINANGDVTISSNNRIMYDNNSNKVLAVTSQEGTVSITGGNAEKKIPAFADDSNLTVTAAGNITIDDQYPTVDYSNLTSTSGTITRPASKAVTINVGENNLASIDISPDSEGILKYTSTDTGNTTIASGNMAYTDLIITGTAENVTISVSGIPGSGSVTLKDLHIDNSKGSKGFPLTIGAAARASDPAAIPIGIEGNVELIGASGAVEVNAGNNVTLSGSGNFTAAGTGASSGSIAAIHNSGTLGIDVEGDVTIRAENSASDGSTALFENGGSSPVTIEGKNVTLEKTGTASSYESGVENSGVTVTATGKLSQIGLISGNLTCAESDQGDLAVDGYHWDATNKTLTLDNVAITGTVTLPDDTVTINTTGPSSIGTLAITGGSPQKTQLTFTGPGKLTVQERISLDGGDGNTLTVDAGATVAAEKGISGGRGAAVNFPLTINGTLIARSTDATAIYAGKVVVRGPKGELYVSGKEGVLLGGMDIPNSGLDFTGVFTIEENGSFYADCTDFNVTVVSPSGTFPEGSNPDKAISLPNPEAYLPTNCKIKQNDGAIDFVFSDTGTVYTGPMAIHENHDYTGAWRCDDETYHSQECSFEGCNKRGPKSPHVYDDNTDLTCNSCGYTRTRPDPPDPPTPPVHYHSWSTWITDDAEHWIRCTTCGAIKDRAAHIYDDDRDAVCNVCGYERTPLHVHVWAEDWSSDSAHHWHACTAEGCDLILSI